MKLSIKLAGLSASGGFSLLLLTGTAREIDPLNLLWLVLPGGIIMGVIGYFLGETLGNPKGHLKPKKGKSARGKTAAAATPSKRITGEETFLDDLDTIDDTAIPSTPSLDID
ncbi:MAG: hypothetical protein AB7P76_02650 [Candidatus Melainabacteria bacterium]